MRLWLLTVAVRSITSGSSSLGDSSTTTADPCTGATAALSANDLAHDQTSALNAAIVACEGRSVTVPPGTYRIDGTVTIGSAATDPARNRSLLSFEPTHLHLPMGVTLRRFGNLSNSPAPVVRLSGYGCRLTGDGARIVSDNASPVGVLHIGPGDRTVRSSIQFTYVSGLHVIGRYSTVPKSPHDSATPPAINYTDIDLNPPWTHLSGYEQCGGWEGQRASFGSNGSVGVCMDSSQPISAGAAYQQTLRDLVIAAVDVGLYMGKWVNANQIDNLQFISIGTVSMWLEDNSENTIAGGFTGGTFPGSPYPFSLTFKEVIRGTTSLFNWFSGVQGEPGVGRYFSFDNTSEMNSVLGHDNFANGPESHDGAFLYLNSGSVSATRTVSGSKLICSGGDGNSHDVCAKSASTTTMRERLQELVTLKNEGLISAEEHVAARRAVLGIVAAKE